MTLTKSLSLMRRLTLAVVALFAWQCARAQYSGSGTGTSNDPYLIFNPAQVNQVRNFLGSSNSGVYFKLMADIDMSAWIAKNSPAKGWQAIGTSSSPFQGTFLGNGHKITGLYSDSGTGFFGVLTSAYVSDLTLEVDFSNSMSYSCGGFASSVTNGTFNNITISGKISTTRSAGAFAAAVNKATLSNITVTGCQISGGQYCGGIAGKMTDTTISDSRVVKGSVSGYSYIGGIAGEYVIATPTSLSNTILKHITLSNLYTDVEITASYNTSYLGGLIGRYVAETTYKHFNNGYTSYTYYYTPTLTLTKCASKSKINGRENVGGLVGICQLSKSILDSTSPKPDSLKYQATLVIDNCFSLCDISGVGSVGGLVGNSSVQSTAYNNLRITDSYFNGNLLGTGQYVGGIIGKSMKSVILRCYASANISGKKSVGGIIGGTVAVSTSEGAANTVRSCVSACPVINASESDGGRIVGEGSINYGASGTSDANLALASTMLTVNGKIVTQTAAIQGDDLGEETLKMRATYQGKGWNFTNSWRIQETECYPYKDNQTAPPIITNQPETGSMVIYGKSISGGEVFVTVGDSSVSTTCDGDNNWMVRVEEPLKAGQTITAYAVGENLLPSFSVQTTVGFIGSGTAEDPYQIYTANDLANINGDSHYLLMNDIDLEGIVWTPIGQNSGAMCHLDGNNHIITGLTLNKSSTSYCGLFASLHSGSVKDLVISGATVNGSDYCGILAGNMTNSTVTNCQVEGTVNGGNYTGGLVGAASGTGFANCRVIADVTGTALAGGVAGYASGKTTFTLLTYNGTVVGGTYAGGITSRLTSSTAVDRCFTSGSITAKGSNTYAGGIAGENSSSITDSYSTAEITSGQYAAGIAGLNKGSISRCYASGSINSVDFAAGIAGYNDGAAASLDACLAANEYIHLTAEHPIGMRVLGGIRNGAVIPEFGSNFALEQMIISLNGVEEDIYDDPLQGVAVTTSQTKDAETYTSMGWNFTSVWHIDGNGGMPYLAELGATEGGSVLPDNYLTLSGATAEAGERIELLVDLNNKNQIAALQFDIALPEGITIATDTRNRPLITLGSRINSTKHSITSRIGGNGLMRVLLTARSAGNVITGNTGNVAKITLDIDPALVNGNYKVELKSIVLSDADPTISIYPPACQATITVVNDHLNVNPADGQAGGKAVVSVDMTNKSDIVGYQFDLVLPEGVTVATNSLGKPAFAHGDRASNLGLSFEARPTADNTTRVLCFSTANKVIPANEGELFNITLDIADYCVLGEHPILFRNIYLGNADNASIPVADITSTLTVTRFIRKGDVNVDGIINVSDITGLSELVGGSTDPRLDRNAADINEDSNVTIQDLPLEMNLVFAEASGYSARRVMAKAGTAPELRNMQIYLEPFSIMPGETKAVRLYINNPEDEVFAFQMRTELPEGLEFVKNDDGQFGIPCPERSEDDFTLTIQSNRGGYGIVGYNGMGMYTFFDTEGPVCEVFVKAADNAPAGIYKAPVFETMLTDPYGSGFLTLDNDYTIIVGDVSEVESAEIHGYFTDSTTDELNKALAGNAVITELDLTGVIESKSAMTVKSANPNMLVSAPSHLTLANEQNVITDGLCDRLVLTDGHPFATSREFTAAEASYSRSFQAGTIESLYLPFTATTSSDILIGVYGQPAANSNGINFTVGEQKAHEPCIAIAANEGKVEFTATNAAITPEPAQAFDNYAGTYRHEEASERHHHVTGTPAEITLQKADKLQPFRAYVLADALNPPIVTGIENVKYDISCGDEVIYNLQGIRMQTKKESLPRGIYIVNGEKIFLNN